MRKRKDMLRKRLRYWPLDMGGNSAMLPGITREFLELYIRIQTNSWLKYLSADVSHTWTHKLTPCWELLALLLAH